MTTLDQITVVIPAYNEEKLIGRTLDAVGTQNTDVTYHIVVVDNGSTDDTPNIVDGYPGVTLIEEPAKGTGTAANTGFRHAIGEHNPDLIMRTDADTVPRQDWIEAARHSFAKKPRRELVSGLVLPLRDEYYRRYDEILLPLAYVGYRVVASALKGSRWPLRVARGGNMAVRPAAFEDVGGFPDSDIGKEDDDIALTKQIFETYGFGALGNEHRMVVRTSTRREHKIGYLGLLNYYLNFTGRPGEEVRKSETDGEIDVR